MEIENAGAVVPGEEVQDNAEELEVEVEESGEQATENEGETETKEQAHKRLSGAQKNKLRIQRLEKELEQERRTRQQLTEHLLKTPVKEEKKENSPAEDKRPRKEDFIVDAEAGTYDADKYEEAVDEWRDRQYDKKLKTELEKTLAERETKSKQQSEQSKIEQSWRERESAFEAEHDDYKEVTAESYQFLTDNKTNPSVQGVGAFITTSDHGPALLHYLGENMDEMEKIAAMQPLRAIAELGKIEARLADQKPVEETEGEEEEIKPVVPLVRTPPKPPTPVKKTTARVNADKLRDDMPGDEFLKAFNKLTGR